MCAFILNEITFMENWSLPPPPNLPKAGLLRNFTTVYNYIYMENWRLHEGGGGGCGRGGGGYCDFYGRLITMEQAWRFPDGKLRIS